MVTTSRRAIVLAALLFASFVPDAHAQIDARMLRQPDVSATHIAFVYAGDIWVVPKQGGVAVRLSSPRGEEQFPRFSPDGSRIAFSGNYDGNVDVYVVPAQGGDPMRVTHHPMPDRLVDWHPDGSRVLFVSSRESGRQRYSQFYLAPATGGLPAKLAVPYGEFGSFSPDGTKIAYLPQTQAFRTWKRYRGGWSPDIWEFDLTTLAAKNVTTNDAVDEFPMWHGDTLYFLSDRGAGQKQNIWARSRSTGAVRQITDFRDYDVTFPSLGPADIVFGAGSRLYLLELATDKVSEVPVQVVTDRSTLKTRSVKVGDAIESVSVSPTGKRAAFEARGEIFSVPAENGPVMSLSRSSGVAERYPRWSPDGKTLAYWSDRSGEYELTLRPADGTGTERTLTSLGAGFRYQPQWSPDSTRMAFVDQAMKIRVIEVATGRVVDVDQSPIWMSHGALEQMTLRWSPDSRWLTWARGTADSGNQAVFLYDVTQATQHQATSGYFNDGEPVFDPDGKYLYFLSNRAFDPVYSDFDNSWSYPNSTRIVAVTLLAATPSPLAPKNDAEGGTDKKDEDKKDEGEEGRRKKDDDKKDDAKKDDAKKDDAPAKPKPVAIDLAGFESRVIVLPPKAGNYDRLQAVAGKILYRRQPRTGSGEEKSALVYYDLEEREEKTVLAAINGYEVTADGKKALVLSDKKYVVVDVKADQKLEKVMRTAEMEALVDPSAEWRQMFADAYRFERDLFYDPQLHGVDWKATRDRYAQLIDASVTRWDVNFVLGEFIAELNASHTYNGGGDLETPPARGVGMLGIDWEVADGAYRIARLVSGAAWDTDVRSPLSQPGVDVKVGEYVLAVNGVPLETSRDPWAAFEGLADAAVVLTVNSKPTAGGLASGDREVSAERDGVALPRMDRAAAQARGRGDRRPRRIRVRPEHRRGRAKRAGPPVHGAMAEGRPGHRRALQQRGPDPGSVHRAAEPADAGVLGRARWTGLAMAAGRASRTEGHADQRLERVGRRRLPLLFPGSRPGPAHRLPHVGRPHRHQRIAGPGGWRQRDRADLPDVRRPRPVVCRGPRRRSGHPGGRRPVAAGQGHRHAARTRDPGSAAADQGPEARGAAPSVRAQDAADDHR